MKVMVIVKATKNSEAGILPTPEMFTAMLAFNEKLVNAGIMQSGDGLKPSRAGKRVRFNGNGGPKTVYDGPFAETKELIAGFWIWTVKSLDEAVEWAKRIPGFADGEHVEVRRVAEISDFEDVLSPEQMAREEAMRDEIAKKAN